MQAQIGNAVGIRVLRGNKENQLGLVFIVVS
jgi:hypothetical protein